LTYGPLPRWLALGAALGGCGGEPSPELRPLPEGVGAEACDDEGFEQLRTICLVEAAARSGREAEASRAEAACAAIPEGPWREECRFRSAEELALRGDAVSALRGCAAAGRFARFCVTHVGWKLPPPDDSLAAVAFPSSPEPWVSAASVITDASLRAEAEDTLRARWHMARAYGTGMADPSWARQAGAVDGPYARGGFALEAVRLGGGDAAAARAAFDAATPLTGAPLPLDRRHGRYDGDMRIAEEADLPTVRTYGGGRRLVGADASEDREIAVLEALAFQEPPVSAEAFRPFLDDQRRALRLTALRHFRTRPGADVEEVLSRLAQDPDPAVSAHAKDGLEYRTWRGKGKAAGPRAKRP
jgi:hypothetical protein